MAEEKEKPRKRRVVRSLFMIYAGLCTLLLTGYILLGLGFWIFGRPEGFVSPKETAFQTALGAYMVKEYPQRGDCFGTLTYWLDAYRRETPLPKDKLLKYLGKPDLAYRHDGAEALVYFYDRSDVPKKWAVCVELENGQVTVVGYTEAAQFDPSVYQPYSTPNNSEPTHAAE